MRIGRLAHCLVCPIFLFAVSGCQVLHLYRPVTVQVRDAETKQPIADAAVRLTYPLTRDSLAPSNSSAKTGADGVVRLRAAPYGPIGVLMETSAQGYQPESLEIAQATLRELPPELLVQDTGQRQPDFTVELYAEPRFTAEFILPPGYRGLIRTQIQIDNKVAAVPGERCFRFLVPREGALVVKGPPALKRVAAAEFRARYEGGALLPGKMDLLTVGFHWLKHEGSFDYFVVGTKSEFDRARRGLVPNEAGAQIGKEWYANDGSRFHAGERTKRSRSNAP